LTLQATEIHALNDSHFKINHKSKQLQQIIYALTREPAMFVFLKCLYNLWFLIHSTNDIGGRGLKFISETLLRTEV